ncbi:MAG: PKD domain-containing protein, partial [Bacteroidia bacterium]
AFISGTSPYTFLWNNPAVSTTSVVAGVGAGVYSATVTDVYGCTASGVVNVTQPNQLLLNVSPSVTICYGQLTQIYAAGSGGTQPYTYNWTPSTFTGGGPFAVTPTVTTTYQTGLTDANGCVVNPQVVTVNVTPQLMATGSSAVRCDGATANFAANITSPGNGGPYTYNWSNGSNNANTTVVANFATTPNIYTLTISDGCTVPDAVATYTLDVNPLPSGTFSANIQKGCIPLAVNFTALSSSPSDTYAWDFGNEVFGSGNPGSTIYIKPGVYNVGLTITNQFGCKKDTGVSGYIEAYGLPTAEFSATPWSTSILQPAVQFTNLSANASTYFWDFGDYNSPNNNTTAVNPEHDYEMAGTYVVNLVAINSKGCADTVMHTIEVTPDYALYIPNAFTPDGNGKNDIFQPAGIGIDESNYRMYIFDRWGEIIYTSDNFRKGWDGTIKGDKGIAEEGVYVYKIYVKDLEGNDHQYVGHVTCLPRESKIK